MSQVLQNDVLAHTSTVEAVNRAGAELVASSEGEEASGLQSRLESLGLRWRGILEKTEHRRQQLDSALLQVGAGRRIQHTPSHWSGLLGIGVWQREPRAGVLFFHNP